VHSILQLLLFELQVFFGLFSVACVSHFQSDINLRDTGSVYYFGSGTFQLLLQCTAQALLYVYGFVDFNFVKTMFS